MRWLREEAAPHGAIEGQLDATSLVKRINSSKCVYGEPRFACVGDLGKTHLQLLLHGPLHSLTVKTSTPEIHQLSFLANKTGC